MIEEGCLLASEEGCSLAGWFDNEDCFLQLEYNDICLHIFSLNRQNMLIDSINENIFKAHAEHKTARK